MHHIIIMIISNTIMHNNNRLWQSLKICPGTFLVKHHRGKYCKNEEQQ